MKELCTALLYLLTVCFLTTNVSPDQPGVDQLIKSWAPLIWIHSEELFWPSSVEFYLPFVTVNDQEGLVVQENPLPETLIKGDITRFMHMQTKENLSCPSCTNLDFFTGQPILNGVAPPVYAIYHEYGDEADTMDISYNTFYPYNRGKDACVGIPTQEGCIGPIESLGNHVGDWEHCVLRLRNREPYQLYVSVHSFGAFYYWNATASIFQYYEGEPVKDYPFDEVCPDDANNTKPEYTPKYPATVELQENHPILFSANGSHGLWSSQGVHTYVPGIKLQDFTDEGTPWNTWENLVIIPWQPITQYYKGNLSWLDFLGRWGNLEDGCEYEIITGECQLGSGPGGPRSPKAECFPDSL